MSEYTSLMIGENLGLSIANPGYAEMNTAAEGKIAILEGLLLGEDEEIEVLDDHGDTVEERQFLHYPKPGGLFPWGSTNYGDILLWEMVGDTPEAWPVWVVNGALAWQHPGGVVDFLVRALNGTLACSLLPGGACRIRMSRSSAAESNTSPSTPIERRPPMCHVNTARR